MFIDPILSEIENFLKTKPMSPTIFGLRTVKDGHLVFHLRAGRELRHGLRDKVVAFMETNK